MAECFKSLAAPDARVLILGSVPGTISTVTQQYYVHPRNVFWPVMERLLGDGSELDYSARIDLLMRSRIALGGVRTSLMIANDLDPSTTAGLAPANDMACFLQLHPCITHVFFNGAKAQDLFVRHGRGVGRLRRIELRRLPCTSSANATLSFAAKLEEWRVVADAARQSREIFR